MQGSPWGCVRREIPGVMQYGEKGHACTTTVVVTTNVEGNMVKEPSTW